MDVGRSGMSAASRAQASTEAARPHAARQAPPTPAPSSSNRDAEAASALQREVAYMQRRFRDKFRVLGSMPLVTGCPDSRSGTGPGHCPEADVVPLPAGQAPNAEAGMASPSGEACEAQVAELCALHFRVEVAPTDPDWALPALALEGRVLKNYPAAGTVTVVVEPGSCGLSTSTRNVFDRILANQVVKLGEQADTLRSLLRFVESHASHVLNAAEDILVAPPSHISGRAKGPPPVPGPPDVPRAILGDSPGPPLVVAEAGAGSQSGTRNLLTFDDRDSRPSGPQGSRLRALDMRRDVPGVLAENAGDDRRGLDQGGASQVSPGRGDGSKRAAEASTRGIEHRTGALSLKGAPLLDEAGWDAVAEDRHPWPSACTDNLGDSDGGSSRDDDVDSWDSWEGGSNSSGLERSGSEAEEAQAGDRAGNSGQEGGGTALEGVGGQMGDARGDSWLALRAQGLQLDRLDAVQPVRLSIQVRSSHLSPQAVLSIHADFQRQALG